MAKDASTNDLIETAKSLFFPDGKSHLGSEDLFTFNLGNFGCDIISEHIGEQEPFTLERYVKYNKLTHVMLYLHSHKTVSRIAWFMMMLMQLMMKYLH